MKFGFGRDIITPTIKHRISCSGNFIDYCTDVHDDVYVKSLLLDDDKNMTLIISADLLFHSNHTSPATWLYNLSTYSSLYEEFLLESCKRSIDRVFITMIEGTLEYGFAPADWAMSRTAYALGSGTM